MIRKKHSKAPTAILTADWHLRPSTPTCYTGDFQREQWECVDFVSRLQRQYDCPVWHAGDLFNEWKTPPIILTACMRRLPGMFFTTYGNHDLPQRNIELFEESGVTTLTAAKRIGTSDEGGNWGEPEFVEFNHLGVAISHRMTWIKTPPWPGCDDPSAEELLDKYPQFNLILVGHHHKPFVVEKDGRLLVNPGPLTRQRVDDIDLKPRVYLWYASSNEVEAVYLPIEPGVISREHIDIITDKKERLQKFIDRLNFPVNKGGLVNFVRNVEIFMQVNKVRKPIEDIVWRGIADGDDS